MLVFVVLLALASAAPSPQEESSEGTEIKSRLSVTGGGIIKEGQEVTLTYIPLDTSWNRCSWSLEKEDKTLICMFDINTDGYIDESKCNSDEFKDTLEYVGTSSEECSISVKSVRKQFKNYANLIREFHSSLLIGLYASQWHLGCSGWF